MNAKEIDIYYNVRSKYLELEYEEYKSFLKSKEYFLIKELNLYVNIAKRSKKNYFIFFDKKTNKEVFINKGQVFELALFNYLVENDRSYEFRISELSIDFYDF